MPLNNPENCIVKDLSLRTLNIIHWSLLAIAALLIAFQLIQLITGGTSNEIVAWIAIGLILIDLALTKFVRKPKSEE